tara:strand:- start:2624 stop:3448 length:825 start_codon:yes stop_codon:yes gene_type:complete
MITSFLNDGDVPSALRSSDVTHDSLHNVLTATTNQFDGVDADVATLIPNYSTCLTLFHLALEALPFLLTIFVTTAVFDIRNKNKTVQLVTESENNAVERTVAWSSSQIRTEALDVRGRLAVHEAGHKIVGQAIEELDNMSRTITELAVASNDSRIVNGVNESDCTEDTLTMLLAGYAAEALVFGGDSRSVSAINDVKRAHSIAKQWTMQRCVNGSSATLDDVSQQKPLDCMDESIEALLDTSYTRATSILNAKRENVLCLIRLLLDNDTAVDPD